MIAIPDDQPIIGSPSFGWQACTWTVQRFAFKRPLEEQRQIVAACLTISQLANIGDLFLLCWAAKECAWFQSARWTQSFNPAGLGATNDGAWGHSFPTPAAGLFAMAGHAINYAVRPEQMTQPQRFVAALDPRAEALRKAYGFGSAPRFVDLWQKWGFINDPARVPPQWSKDAYGISILERVRTVVGLLDRNSIAMARQ